MEAAQRKITGRGCADNVDRGANLTLLTYPSVDSIEEFRVVRGQYEQSMAAAQAAKSM